MNLDWNLKTIEPVFPNFNAIPTTITKIIMVSYPDEFDGHLVHNSTVAFRVWRVKVLNNNFSQEPITWSEQLTCPRVTAFSRTSLFLERLWREFWISFKFHKPVSKTYRLKNYIFCLLVTFKFPFWNFILRIWTYGGDYIFAGESTLNWYVRTPWNRHGMRVVRPWLWTPASAQNWPKKALSSSLCEISCCSYLQEEENRRSAVCRKGIWWLGHKP